MARCWTCGAHMESPVFTCPACSTVREIQGLRKEAAANLDALAEVQRRGFEKLPNTLSEGLSQIASVIEWGFEEISWELQQQTEVLQSIDRTLKTPSQTQANEWRQMAEELRSRGVLDKSEEFFLKSLEVNPLDYRSYVGLAEAYLQMNRFDKAKTCLENSLPHAPSPDYKSYSYRLIGHVYACKEDYPDAVSALRSATELSPTYYVALYDLAQYSAQMRDKEACLSTLKTAIDVDISYFYLAEKERNLEPLSSEVGNLLNEISTDASDRAKTEISKTEEMLRAAERSIAEAREALRSEANKERELASSIAALENARSKLSLAKDKVALKDYRTSLDAIPLGKEAYDLADEAKNSADGTPQHYEYIRSLYVKQALKSALITVALIMLFGGLQSVAILGGIGYAIGREIGVVFGVFSGIVGIVLFGRWIFLRKLRRYIDGGM